MEVIELRVEQLNKALNALSKGMFLLNTVKYDPDIYLLLRDRVIQRFEFSIESLWKFFKIYLETNKKVVFENNTAKAILRVALQELLITEEESDLLLLGIADRNLTSHTYNEEVAQAVHCHISEYYQIMKIIADRLHQEVRILS